VFTVYHTAIEFVDSLIQANGFQIGKGCIFAPS